MFAITVIVHRNRAGANVDARANLRIANIGVMIDLGAFAHT